MYISLCDIKIMFSWGEVGKKCEGKKMKKKNKIKKIRFKVNKLFLSVIWISFYLFWIFYIKIK